MLDIGFVVVVLALTAITVLYGDACELLLRNDSTRDTDVDTPA
jgi:hypothetical protein